MIRTALRGMFSLCLLIRGLHSLLDSLEDKQCVLLSFIDRSGGISQKMLTQTLRHLERDALVQRTVYAEVPPRVEYALTPLGRNLRELIAPMREWSNVHVKDIIAAQQQYDTQTLNEK